MTSSADDRVLDRLARWEASLDAGQELSVEELAGGDSILAARLQRWIEPLRATRWVRSVVTDTVLGPQGEPLHVADETADPRTRDTKQILPRIVRGADDRHPDISREQFLLRLEASGVLSAADLKWVQDDSKASTGSDLAARLVQDGLLTEFQADSLLQGDFSRLVLGNYVLLQPLGSGGMGDVFLARHRVMDRLVALKTLPSSSCRYRGAIERFHQEIKALAHLSHPNIVTAHDAAEHRGLHFFVMEYVPGEDLAALVERGGPLPWQLAAEYCRQAAEGLAYAHAKGILHRDVKPSNLMVVDSRDQWLRVDARDAASLAPAPSHQPLAPRLKILDLGLSRAVEALADGQDRITRTNAILGTADFMAPEQSFDSARVDHRADIYALGCTLYYLLTGQPVFKGETVGEKLLAHRNDVPDLSGAGILPALASGGEPTEGQTSLGGRGSRRAADIPTEPPLDITTLLATLLAKSPADRPQSMSVVAAALAALLRGESLNLPLPLGEGRGEGFAVPPRVSPSLRPSVSAPTSPPLSHSRRLPRRGLLTAGLATVAASAAGLGTFAIYRQLAYGTVHVQLPPQRVPVEFLVDNKPVERRHIRYRDTAVELDLPSGKHDIRILLDAHYPSIHEVHVPFRGDLTVAASFAPAFRWRFTGDHQRLGCIEAAEEHWIGWNLDVNGEASVVRELPVHWSILSRSSRSGPYHLSYDSKRTLASDGGDWQPFHRCKFEDVLDSEYCWRIYDLPGDCFAAEYAAVLPNTGLSRRGYYLTPKSAIPRIVTKPDGKDSFDANHVGISIRPPPRQPTQNSNGEKREFSKRRVHVVVAGGQNHAGLYLSIDESSFVVFKDRDQFSGGVRLTSEPSTQWDVVPAATGHALRVASGKFKNWWLDIPYERRMEEQKMQFAADIMQLMWGGRVIWTIEPAKGDSFTLQVCDKYFPAWHLAPPPAGASSSSNLGPGLSLPQQPIRWEFRTP